MTLYESLSIAIAGIALIVTIWAHKRVNKINAKIQYIWKLSTSGEQSPIVTGNEIRIFNYNFPDNKASED